MSSLQGRNRRRTPPRRGRRHAVVALVALCAGLLVLAFAGTTVATAKKQRTRSDYLRLAEKGISDARSHWWNGQHNWFNDRLNDNDPFPLATIWTLFGLWEGYSGVAKAKPTDGNKGQVDWFSDTAETYYNACQGGYGPYPGSRGCSDEIWFDDNGWWGLGFVDAYLATKNHDDLGRAANALAFMNKGWDSKKKRFGWSTHKSSSGPNLETLGGAAALAAELYQYDGRKQFKSMARTYLNAAKAKARWTYKKHGKKKKHPWRHIYEAKTEGPLSYVQGTFLGAHLALCRTGDQSECRATWDLLRVSYKHWRGKTPRYNPPGNTILFRYVLRAAGEKKVQQVAAAAHGKVTARATWKWARRAAEDALNKARQGGLFLKFWDGSAASSHKDGYRSYVEGSLLVHGAPVALLAWLAASCEPKPGYQVGCV